MKKQSKITGTRKTKEVRITTILKRYLNSEECDNKTVDKLNAMIQEYKQNSKQIKINKINKEIARLEKERQQLTED